MKTIQLNNKICKAVASP